MKQVNRTAIELGLLEFEEELGDNQPRTKLTGRNAPTNIALLSNEEKEFLRSMPGYSPRTSLFVGNSGEAGYTDFI
jgi:hypothetical protein